MQLRTFPEFNAEIWRQTENEILFSGQNSFQKTEDKTEREISFSSQNSLMKIEDETENGISLSKIRQRKWETIQKKWNLVQQPEFVEENGKQNRKMTSDLVARLRQIKRKAKKKMKSCLVARIRHRKWKAKQDN